MRVITIALGLLIAACGSTSSMTVTTSGDVSSVAAYKTYSHATAKNAPEGYMREELRPELLERIRQEVDRQLQTKGYQPADNGELVVRISTGRRKVEDQPTGAAAAIGAPAETDEEGAIVIDIFEQSSQKQLFHGYAHDVIHGDEVKDAQVRAAVGKMLADVPAR
jgi:hypothetical protein